MAVKEGVCPECNTWTAEYDRETGKALCTKCGKTWAFAQAAKKPVVRVGPGGRIYDNK